MGALRRGHAGARPSGLATSRRWPPRSHWAKITAMGVPAGIGIEVDPNRGVDAVRELDRAVTDHGIVAAHFFPSGKNPPVAIDSPLAYLVYAKCVELGIPVFVQGGVPGPRVGMAAQHPGLVDE